VAFLDLFRPRRLEPLGRPLRRGSLTASARLLSPEQGKALAKGSRNRTWQAASFTYRVAIPEVGYVMRFLGNNSTHIRLFVGDRRGDDIHELDDDYGIIPGPNGTEVRDPDALPADVVALARDALDELTGSSPSGGGAAILSPIVQAFEGPGECYLVGRYDPEADESTWGVHSISELTARDGRYPGSPDGAPAGYWRLNTGEGRDAEKIDLDPALTTVYRLWTADSQWSSEPDSPMRTLVGTCERLLLIDRANDASLRTRAGGNGFLLMPDELSFGPDGAEDDPDAPDDDTFQRDMTTQLVTPLAQDGSAASAVPGIIRGPYAYLDRIRHLTLERPLDPKLAELEARLLTRLGIGLDVPPEVLTGYADVNHWNVAQVSEDTFKLHQEPVTIKAVEAATLGYMRTALLDAGVPRDLAYRVVIWFDPASLIAPRDQREAANDAYDRQAISGRAYRRLLHLDEGDAPELDAAQPDEPVGQTGLLAAQLTALFDIAGSAIRAGYAPDSVSEQLGLGAFRHTGFRPVTVAEPEVPIIEGGPSIAPEPAALPPGEPPAEEAPVEEEPPAEESPEGVTAAATSSTGHEPTAAQRRLSRRLMQIDRELRTKLQAAADAALHRALERAGNRLRARARANPEAAAKVDGVPGPLVAAALGRALVAALDADDADLLRDAFERFRTQWTEWTATAAEDAIDTAARITGLDRSDVAVQRTVAALRDSFAGGAEAAWPALEAQLTDLATGLMYEPDPQVEALGEIPDTMVPPGVIRAALAVTGGLPSDHDGIRALSGLTSGTLLRVFMRDAGAEPVEYEWAYGISSRPFPPHEALDGQVFSDFNAPELSSAGTGGEWIGDHLAPGDHKGCHCDAALIWADGNSRDEQEIIGRTSYAEQKPGKPVPGWDATVDGKADTPRTRPAPRR
jgi:hypothetical protein